MRCKRARKLWATNSGLKRSRCIEKLMARPGIDAKGPGYRPNRPFAEAKLFNKKEQESCPYPSVAEERHPAVLYESMIQKRQ